MRLCQSEKRRPQVRVNQNRFTRANLFPTEAHDWVKVDRIVNNLDPLAVGTSLYDERVSRRSGRGDHCLEIGRLPLQFFNQTKRHPNFSYAHGANPGPSALSKSIRHFFRIVAEPLRKIPPVSAAL